VIPPAWQEGWICPDPGGHIQAIGTDAAGRRQYLYHERWREEQDRAKFDRMVEFGRALPRLRRTVLDRLEGRGLHRDRVLAAVVRIARALGSLGASSQFGELATQGRAETAVLRILSQDA
jgi:DNA topoisomerase-1